MKHPELIVACILTVACSTNKEQSSNNNATQMTGAYGETVELTSKDDSLFRAVVAPQNPDLTPVKVSHQVVAGMNYRFVCEDKDGQTKEVVVYEPLPGQGEAQIVEE